MLHVQNIAQQNVNNTQTDGKGNVTTYEYNVANKPTKKIDHGGIKTVEGKITYEPNKTETYTYYSNAQMATKTDRNGKITNYKYDIHARLLSKTIDKEEVSYSYDSNGNQLAMTDTTGTTTRIYDELGRVISKSVPNLGATTFQYDILVNSKTIPELTSNYTIPEGSTAEKSKDPKGNETTKVSDGAGRLVFVISEGKVTSYTYDANGNRASVVYPDGKTKETYQYYRDNRLKKLTNTRANGSVMDEYSYTYDGAHNQTSKTERIKGILKGTTSYTYDSLNRLAEVLEPKKTTETRGKLTKYTYDAAGNRETEQITTSTAAGTQVTVSTYKYNEQNRLLSTTEETGDGTKKTTTYSYDPNGNMTKKSFEQTRQIDPSNPPTPKFGMYIKGQQDGATENAKPIAAGTASYEYDVWNQLVKASTGDGSSTYKYNGEGYRTEKTENGVLTRSLYEADKVILETDKNGKETARNIYGTTLISRTVTTTENGTTQKDQYNYMYNGHADVTALLTADGTIVASYYYDAFGTVLEKNENKGINNPYRYAGYVYDNATSLYYLNARYYDSKIARFMSEDTYTGDQNDPLSLNLYSYCANNPIIYIDPTGHASANINVGGIPVGNAQVNNGVSTGNLTDIAKGLGIDKPVYDKKTNTTSMEVNGQKVTFDCSKSSGVASDGTPYTIVNGKIQVGVKDMAKKADVQDTISWWNDDKKQTNVVVQPDMKYVPVQVTRSGDDINIKAFIDFTGDSNNYFPGTVQSYITSPGAKVPQSGYTYAEVAADGIMNNWNGTFYGTDYDFGKGKVIKVKTTIYSNDFSPNKILTPVLTSNKQQFLKINIDNDNPTKILGIQVETKIPHTSFANSWSISEPGEIYMYRNYNGQGDDYSRYGYAQTVAHEFGHVLGLDDAYGGGSRPEAKSTTEVPNNKGFYNGDIMRDNGFVTANDVEMLWEARSTNKWQYFENYNGHKKSIAIKLK